VSFVADLGGRRLKYAATTQGRLGPVQVMDWPDEPQAEDWLRLATAFPKSATDGSIVLSSSRPAAAARWKKQPGWSDRIREVGPSEVPIPRQTTGTGTDRLLASWAAWRRAGRACFVLDCGTAWTLDGVDQQGQFRGGAIGPGLRVAEAGLARACPHLAAPAERLPLGLPAHTNEAVAAGTALHMAVGIEALVARWGTLLGGNCALFLAGGDAAALRPHLRLAWQIAPDLVLEGMAALQTTAP